ncbi:hypothetical protein ELI_1645 [Eubacterium callanderi]|uniref:Uncharacterized protein n=1 Tax=Eubacterium callanderi TaxID=53442 RepID=E3GLK7_9FIRM|nr:hypothetical protein ELI_1645 [Eubacterium callanderi]
MPGKGCGERDSTIMFKNDASVVFDQSAHSGHSCAGWDKV